MLVRRTVRGTGYLGARLTRVQYKRGERWLRISEIIKHGRNTEHTYILAKFVA